MAQNTIRTTRSVSETLYCLRYWFFDCCGGGRYIGERSIRLLWAPLMLWLFMGKCAALRVVVGPFGAWLVVAMVDGGG